MGATNLNPLERPLLTGKQVLLVGDTDEKLLELNQELNQLGAQVLAAQNVNATLEKLKANKVDVIVSHLKMSKGSGIDLIAKLRSLSVQKPVILLVSNYSELGIDENKHNGADAIFTYPCETTELAEAIRSLSEPRQLGWMRKSARLDSKFMLSFGFKGQNQALEALVINFSKGGMCIEFFGIVPSVGMNISFQALESEQALKVELNGEGICRWVQVGINGNASRLGIEFTNLSDEKTEEILNLLIDEKTRPQDEISTKSNGKYTISQ